MHTLFPGVAVFLRSRVFERIFATTIDSLQTCVSACVCVQVIRNGERERSGEGGKKRDEGTSTPQLMVGSA